MDNMKPLRWCQATTPLTLPGTLYTGVFSECVQKLVDASEEVRKTYFMNVRAAWSDRPADMPGDAAARLNPAFWSHTEPAFFAAVEAVCRALETNDATALDAARTVWLHALHRAALGLFDTFAAPDADLAAPDLRRAVVARSNLLKFTSPNSRKLRVAVGLPVETDAAKSKPKKPSQKANASAKESTS
jgi:hypothetical protein